MHQVCLAPPGAVDGGAAATPGTYKWPGPLFSLRLFKLKKRYRNVLDTMFELLPRMARYCPASWPPGPGVVKLVPASGRAAGWSWEGEEESRKGWKSRV